MSVDDEDRGGRNSPWYAEGLRFSCQPECGACCVDHGSYAYVYLEGDDAARLASFLESDLDSFLETHTEVDDGERILRMNGPECPFLDGARCTVYPARPAQCRTFPFWSENLASRRAWRRLREFCPGIDRGERHDLIAIEDQRRKRD